MFIHVLHCWTDQTRVDGHVGEVKKKENTITCENSLLLLLLLYQRCLSITSVKLDITGLILTKQRDDGPWLVLK